MYREKLQELRDERKLTNKKWAELSGVSIDTISRIIRPDNPEKDSPKVSTLVELCEVLGVELWEIFYIGDKSLVSLQAEITLLKEERDALLAENAVQKDKIETLRDKMDTLKDELIAVHNYYIKQNR